MLDIKFIVSQIGAREHYAIPKAINNMGLLKKFYTDVWINPKNDLILRPFGKKGQALKQRFDNELRDSAYSIGNFQAILKQIFPSKDIYKHYCNYGSYFANKINTRIRNDKTDFTHYFTYNTGALETFELLKGSGKTLILGQIDPGKTEREIVKIESEKYPGWATDQYYRAPDFYFERIEKEWELANFIVVNSEWTKTSLIQQGVSEKKIKILQLGYEKSSGFSLLNKSKNNQKLKVLYAANVTIRKGIQYFLESAASLIDYDIDFIVAGPINIARNFIENAPKNVTFTGKINRNELWKLYATCDIYILPTLSDGFAITQIEALSFGLPVITTNRCGNVVTNAEDGFIINPYSSLEITHAILKFYNDRDFLLAASKQAILKSKQFDYDQLIQNLFALINEI